MEADRIAVLQKMLKTRPNDGRAHFGLALEYERLGRWGEVVTHLEAYLSVSDDEGNGHGRLARALRHLGQEDEASAAFRAGIEAAGKHGHPSLAAELEEELETL